MKHQCGRRKKKEGKKKGIARRGEDCENALRIEKEAIGGGECLGQKRKGLIYGVTRRDDLAEERRREREGQDDERE